MVDVTGSVKLYHNYAVEMLRGLSFQPESNAWKMGLLLDSYTPNLLHDTLSDIVADEVFGNGYSRQTLTNVVVTEGVGYVDISFDQAEFMASGGNLEPRYWFIFDDTASDQLVGYGEIDAENNVSILIIDGQPLTVVPNELGFFRIKLDEV